MAKLKLNWKLAKKVFCSTEIKFQFCCLKEIIFPPLLCAYYLSQWLNFKFKLKNEECDDLSQKQVRGLLENHLEAKSVLKAKKPRPFFKSSWLGLGILAKCELTFRILWPAAMMFFNEIYYIAWVKNRLISHNNFGPFAFKSFLKEENKFENPVKKSFQAFSKSILNPLNIAYYVFC